MSKRHLAFLAAFGASFIYGVNHTLAKDLMPTYIEAYGFIMLRVLGAAILFWITSLFLPSEKIDRKDWWRIILCALFGMTINMLMFFKGLQLSTPINSSVVITLSPVILLILSALFLKEKITWLKGSGIAIGLVGALILILFGAKTQANAPNIPLGNTLFIINAIAYSVYLILVKPLTAKYASVTLMKWFFLIAVFTNAPIALPQFLEVQWFTLPPSVIGVMLFVVIGTTYLTYLFNVFALRQLKPSTIGAFIYIQPLIATLVAIILGADTLTTIRVVAATLIFLGVYLSTKRKKASV
ncbi:DMT family transporter [Dokdonia donghaensis]|uniref:Multidrug transporter n=1 Tax=Dokdonia donghaensis DSW-1 TaxID=1300343 RepID=A0A0A2GXG9_9FLAO|nr:DMT family transporter [Dokdonia donghaensis]ANH59680.1 putative DMT superfamily transporter inner membrane protein [Dokdonia donghaensis DSW-1]KGO07031.1 multidrug transporter [Dokdonia donghaensis DSW-1]